jgi:hypothetical protein
MFESKFHSGEIVEEGERIAGQTKGRAKENNSEIVAGQK